MVPINKLGQYFESDDSNAVISISYHQRKVEAILDSGAVVSIMTKQCWEKWGSLPIDRKSTRLNSSHSGESRMPSSA